ncbi:MAG TPA: FAD-dependent oxidoreductase [Solirubrobacteraceae bacterium]|jgi:2-polyprenyl-6-methoxyphenol hydroxylase-like FAD-dependent oxidoreductase|nr:FAD-dependent oxidoreductase [Solirubrobacteraceae bacterium]
MANAVSKVLVVGGGISGLASAIALTARGIEVDLVEQNPSWDVYGVGIIQPGNAIRALDQLGLIDDALAAGFAMDGDRFHLADGTLLADNEFPRVAGPEYPGLNGITRPKLHEILTSAVRRAGTVVTLGVTVEELDQDQEGVDVRLTDGSTGRYDLVIGADGVYSLIRKLEFPEEPAPRYTGQAVWRYNLPRPPEVNKLWMFAGPESKAGLVPLSADLMYVLLIETPGGETPPWQDETQLAQTLRDKLRPFGGLIAELRELVTDSSQVVYRPIETVAIKTPWQRGRVALIGDAAHATSPHVGQGAALAMEDAIVLAEEVAGNESLGDAFDRFGDRRYERVKTIVDISTQIGQWEIEHTVEADFLGLTMQSVITTAAPI